MEETTTEWEETTLVETTTMSTTSTTGSTTTATTITMSSYIVSTETLPLTSTIQGRASISSSDITEKQIGLQLLGIINLITYLEIRKNSKLGSVFYEYSVTNAC